MKDIFKQFQQYFCIHKWENTGDPDGTLRDNAMMHAFKEDDGFFQFAHTSEHTCRKCGKKKMIGSGIMNF